MPDFELSEDYQDLSNTVRAFADEVVAPVSAKHDEEHSFPYEVVSQMADMGLFGLPFPEEFGGMGGDYFALALALEQLGRVDQSVAITLEAGVSLGAMPIHRFGNEAQKEEWLPLLASGKALAGFGLTEPEAGSDAGGTKTTAKLGGGEWVINGNKEFITNSGTDITKLVTVTAVTGQEERPDGSIKKEISTILVPTNTPGFKAEKAYNKVGWNASDTTADPRQRPRPRGKPAGHPGPRLRQLPLHPGRGPHRDRRAGGRRGPGLRGPVGEIRQGTQRVRAEHRQVPGHRVQDRPDGSPRTHRPAGLLRRCRPDARRQAVQDAGGHR